MATKVGDLYIDFGKGADKTVGTVRVNGPLTLERLTEIANDPVLKGVSSYSDLVKLPTGDFARIKPLQGGEIAFEIKPIVAAHDFAAAVDRIKALFDGDFDGRCTERCGRMVGCVERCAVLEADHQRPRVGPFHIFRQHECRS